MTFLKGKEARVGDFVRVQRGEHAGKAGLVKMRADNGSLFVHPFAGASWSAFWINEADVAVDRNG